MLPPLSPASITIDNISHLFDSAEVHVLRLDKLHPVIAGNKWFKLRYYLEEAKTQQKKNIITFGGAWSNHIVATAAICHMQGVKATGIIRGEEPAQLSASLLQAKEFGMHLVFIPRTDYSYKIIPAEFTGDENYLIHEGGYGIPGARGAATILDYCDKNYSHYCCAAGTGTMAAGLINRINGQTVTAISVMKNNRGLEHSISHLLHDKHEASWQVIHDYHFGGYAKYESSLLQFMNDFYSKTTIPSDFVYTGKLFYAISDLLQKKFFPPGCRILLIHSGGLQGNASLRKGTLLF